MSTNTTDLHAAIDAKRGQTRSEGGRRVGPPTEPCLSAAHSLLGALTLRGVQPYRVVLSSDATIGLFTRIAPDRHVEAEALDDGSIVLELECGGTADYREFTGPTRFSDAARCVRGFIGDPE